MTKAWCAAMAQPGKIYVLREQAFEHGVPVMVPTTYTRHGVGGSGRNWAPRIDPYLFLFFDLNDNEQEAVVRSLRGFLEFLAVYAGADVRRKIKPISPTVIQDYIAMECAEQRGATFKLLKLNRDGVQMNHHYRIIRHRVDSFIGKEGELIMHLRGVAYLKASNGMMIEVSDSDIEHLGQGRKAA